jgi:hypothetical protein
VNQSTFIAGALLAGFVLYVAAKGRLATYSAVLWGPTNEPVPSGGSTSASSTTGQLGSALAGNANTSAAASSSGNWLAELGASAGEAALFAAL